MVANAAMGQPDVGGLLYDSLRFADKYLAPSPDLSRTLPVYLHDPDPGPVGPYRIGLARTTTKDDICTIAVINRELFRHLIGKLGDSPIWRDGGAIIDNQHYYYLNYRGMSRKDAIQSFKFWTYVHNNADRMASSRIEFSTVVNEAKLYSEPMQSLPNSTKRETTIRAATMPNYNLVSTELGIAYPKPAQVLCFSNLPQKVLSWKPYDVSDLMKSGAAAKPITPDRRIEHLAQISSQATNSPIPELPKYNGVSKIAQPGDIVVRTGGIGTIPHTYTYFGPQKIGDMPFDSVELVKIDRTNQAYILPKHWTADTGPNQNFYRLLESDIPCMYNGEKTTLVKLPSTLKQKVIQDNFEVNIQSLGSNRGDYVLPGVNRESNQCVDFPIESYSKAFAKNNIQFTNRRNQNIDFSEVFSVEIDAGGVRVQSSNPMSDTTTHFIASAIESVGRTANIPISVSNGFAIQSSMPRVAAPYYGITEKDLHFDPRIPSTLGGYTHSGFAANASKAHTIAAPNFLGEFEPPKLAPRTRKEWVDTHRPFYWGGDDPPPPPGGQPLSTRGGVLLGAEVVKDQPADTSDLLGSE